MAVREGRMTYLEGQHRSGWNTRRARRHRDETAAEVYRKARVAQHLREGKWWRVRHQSPMHHKLLHVNGHLYAVCTHVLADMNDRGSLGRRETLRWWELRSITGGESERFLSPLAVQRRIRELRAALPYQRETRPLLLPAAVQPVDVDVDTSQCWWNRRKRGKTKPRMPASITIGSRAYHVVMVAGQWILADEAGQLKATGFATPRDLQAYIRKVRAWARAAHSPQNPPPTPGSPPEAPTNPPDKSDLHDQVMQHLAECEEKRAASEKQSTDWVQAIIADDQLPDESTINPAALDYLKANVPRSWYTAAAYLNYALGTDYLRNDLIAALQERYDIEDNNPPVKEWWPQAIGLALEEITRSRSNGSGSAPPEDRSATIRVNVPADARAKFDFYGDALTNKPARLGYGFFVERAYQPDETRTFDEVVVYHETAPDRKRPFGTAQRISRGSWKVNRDTAASRRSIKALVAELGLTTIPDEVIARLLGLTLALAGEEVPF